MSPSHRHEEDAALVALIDGEADAAERARLEALLARDPVVAERFDTLSRTSLDFAAAFRPMLDEAPAARLQAMLSALPAPSASVLAPAAAVPAAGGGRRWNRREMLAAGIALFVAGSLVPHFAGGLLSAPAPDEDDDHGDDWRAVVAAYLDLYTAETLANLPGDDAALNQQLADVGGALGLRLSTDTVQLAGLRLKRAQTFRYDDEPLAQIAYLDADQAPTALCIIARAGAPAGLATEQRRGMNVAFWGNATHQFMLIGRRPLAEMQDLAAGLVPRLDA